MEPGPGTKLMTPSGRPASRITCRKCQADSDAVSAALKSTTLPMSAGAVARFTAMELKLNGATANTKPSSGR